MSAGWSKRRLLSTLFACVILASLGLAASPASAAGTPEVSVKTSASTVVENSYIKISGTVSKNSQGAKVALQRRQGSAAWKSVTSATVSKRKSYAVAVKVPRGTWYYRVEIAKNKQINRATSKTVRVTATKKPLTDAQKIERIFSDTNSFRTTHGKPALKFSSGLNKVAGRWAKHLHDSCSFEHNPDYSAQIPPRWTRAGENIAARYTYSTVVQAWISSPGHRANLLGNFTHIGIGYFSGPNCDRTYFVQDFAKY